MIMWGGEAKRKWEKEQKEKKEELVAEYFSQHGMTEEEWKILKTKEAVEKLEKTHGEDFKKLNTAIEKFSTTSDYDPEFYWGKVISKSMDKPVHVWMSDD